MSKITLKKALLLMLFSISTILSYGQVIGYQCSFEDSIENSLWDLNVGDQGESCINKWYVGKAGAHNGSSGLFVSSDGQTNNYHNNPPKNADYDSQQPKHPYSDNY